MIAQPLVVKHQLSDFGRKLLTLPLALLAAGSFALSFRSRRLCGLNRIGSRTKLVCGNVRDRRGLTRRVSGMPRCSIQASGRPHRMAGRRSSLRHPDLAPRPGSRLVDCVTRSLITRLCLFEEMQHMLRAHGSPDGKKLMVGVGESAASTNGDESWIPGLGENHWTFVWRQGLEQD